MTLLCEKTDRLYRNFKDYVTIDELVLMLIFVKEGSVLNKDSRSQEKFIHGIKVLMAKNYIDNLSEETRKGMQEKAEEGEFPAYAPLGYLHDKTNKTIELDPKRGPIAQESEGGSVGLGFATPGQSMQFPSARNVQFSTAVDRVARDPHPKLDLSSRLMLGEAVAMISGTPWLRIRSQLIVSNTARASRQKPICVSNALRSYRGSLIWQSLGLSSSANSG